MCYTKNKSFGFTLIEVLIVLALSAALLSYVYNKYYQITYENDAENYAKLVVRLANNISQSMSTEYGCQKLNNNYAVDKGLLPDGFMVDKSNNPYTITYKYGDVRIISNLRSALLPSNNFGPYDAFGIKLRKYKSDVAVRLVEHALPYFDSIVWGGRIIKGENGIDQVAYSDAIDNVANRTGILFVVWGC